MYNERKYRCLRCRKSFSLADGIVAHLGVGVECPHCGSHLTVERLF